MDTSKLGAEPTDDGTRFVVTSDVAERIELCLFDADDNETDRVDLERGDGVEWAAAVAGVGTGQRYGYRVHGPGDPANGHACDPAKLLVDPAARRVSGFLRWQPELVAPGVDSADLVPRSVVVAPPGVAPTALDGRRPWSDTVVYEAHAGHLTARHPLVRPADRGGYAGLAAPVVIDHLLRLGVTAVELLPVQHFVSESALVAAGSRNVWGYNPLAWGAPHAGYASAGGNPVAELRTAVDALHAAGIEVLLDVVYNHTCEGGLGSGPILSWRGFDNAATYRLMDGPDGLVDDDVTGCGNSIDTESAPVRRLIVETLVRWVEEFGIDGFRFDLGATLIRGPEGPTPASPFLTDIAAEPALADVRLIAEPWDTGLGGYAAGRFPPPWREWNDRFRDDIRDLWRGHSPSWSTVASRLTGSADIYRGSEDSEAARPATVGVSAVATHDGFTLADLVSYDEPVGGGHGQRSSNAGWEGPTDDPVVLAVRQRRQRCLLASTLLAVGVPMINSGDEIGRTQGGTADGYRLEPDAWGLPWPEADWDLAAWTSAAVALRRTHPGLTPAAWPEPGDDAVEWRKPDGSPFDDDAWAGHGPDGLQVVRRGPADAVPTSDAVLLIAPSDAVTFTPPPGDWTIALDTGLARMPVVPTRLEASTITAEGPAVVVLVTTT